MQLYVGVSRCSYINARFGALAAIQANHTTITNRTKTSYCIASQSLRPNYLSLLSLLDVAGFKKHTQFYPCKIISISNVVHSTLFFVISEALRKRDAFVAYTNEFYILLDENDVLPFNKLLVNESSGFDTTSHKFTCQHNGLYIFSTSIVNYYYWNKLGARIVKDGRVISASVYADNYAREWNQGAVTSLVHCAKNEQVWVESSRKSKLHGGIENGESFTQFSGALVQVDL